MQLSPPGPVLCWAMQLSPPGPVLGLAEALQADLSLAHLGAWIGTDTAPSTEAPFLPSRASAGPGPNPPCSSTMPQPFLPSRASAGPGPAPPPTLEDMVPAREGLKEELRHGPTRRHGGAEGGAANTNRRGGSADVARAEPRARSGRADRDGGIGRFELPFSVFA